MTNERSANSLLSRPESAPSLPPSPLHTIATTTTMMMKRPEEPRKLQCLALRFPTHLAMLDVETRAEDVKVPPANDNAAAAAGEVVVVKHRHALLGPSSSPAARIPNVKKSAFNALDGGKLLTIRGDDAVEVLELDSGETRKFSALGKVATASLSPRGTYMTVWQKAEGRLVIVEVATGRERFDFPLKNQTMANTVQWTEDERFVAHLVTNEVRVLSTSSSSPRTTAEDGEKFPIVHRLRVESASQFSLDPYQTFSAEGTAEFAIATFQPSKLGKPVSISLWLGDKRRCSASTFRADECSFRWAPPPPVFASSTAAPPPPPRRSSVLVKTDSTVDATGQSYYGESRLFLLRSESEEAITVVPPKEGSMHDVKWSPRGDVFCVVAGRSPPRCTLFSERGEAIFEFGEAHRNTIAFSPHGRFLVLAGFGNLAGEMDFWDVYKRKRLGFNVADAAVGYAWSPSGRLFMTATLAPRMNVDNGIGIYTYRGSLVGTWPANDPALGGQGESVLLDCQWRPAEGWPDEPKSPSLPGEEEAEAAKANARLAAIKKPVGVYRPKGASSAGASAIAEAMKGARATAGALGEANVKKKPSPAPTPSNSNSSANNNQKPQRGAAPQEKQTPSPAPAPIVMPTTREEAEKRIHKLNKLLKEIELVEKKREEGGESALNDDQKKKLARKPGVTEEIAVVTKALSTLST